MTKVDLVVTRHKALVEVLSEITGRFDLSGATVKEHVEEKDVEGKVVVGVLPMRLAALTKRFFELSLAIPQELRGVELSKDQISQFMLGINEYIVATPDNLTIEIIGDDLSWVSGILKKNENIVKGVTLKRKDMLGEYVDTI